MLVVEGRSPPVGARHQRRRRHHQRRRRGPDRGSSWSGGRWSAAPYVVVPQRHQRERIETRKVKSARVERGESEDTFVWMSVSSRRKNTIRVLAADWSNDRRCESRPSEVQLCTVFFICCLKTVRHKK
jgi:hypothetical protein